MKLPEWARNDSSARLKFFLVTMTSYHNEHCRLRTFAEDAGLHQNTVSRAQRSGRMTKKLALALTKTAPEAGVKPVWLIAPELIQLNEDGEIVE